MKSISRNLPCLTVAVLAFVIGTAVTALGQGDNSLKNKADYKNKDKGFCTNNNWSWDNRVSASDLREMTVASTGSINVDGGQNGGISIKGEDRGDVLIRGCVQTSGKTEEEARAAAANIKIDTGGTIKADGPGDDNHWSVSYQILVPRSTNLDLKAHNGGISVSGAEGTISFSTMNGGVNLNGVAGTVTGKTTNGGINVSLSGTSWKGTGLDVQTTNGGVNVSVPSNFAAHVEAGTVNGGFSSDLPGLQPQKNDDERRWNHSTKVSADLNGGGQTVRIMTTNGGVRINSLNKE